MNKNITFHCLFEQSGTFRDVFRSYGHAAYCYDIQNEYGKTDYQIDLFREIELEYDNICENREHKTVFTEMNPETDFIMAFFPCTYFSDFNDLIFKCEGGGRKKGERGAMKRNAKNIAGIIKREYDRAYFYEIFVKMCFICEERKIPIIIENPHGMYKNYLWHYSPYRPTYIENDRSRWGDKFVKPTIYIAVNFEMRENFLWYDVNMDVKRIAGDTKAKSKERSEISPRYADNFYKRFFEDIKQEMLS